MTRHVEVLANIQFRWEEQFGCVRAGAWGEGGRGAGQTWVCKLSVSRETLAEEDVTYPLRYCGG